MRPGPSPVQLTTVKPVMEQQMAVARLTRYWWTNGRYQVVPLTLYFKLDGDTQLTATLASDRPIRDQLCQGGL